MLLHEDFPLIISAKCQRFLDQQCSVDSFIQKMSAILPLGKLSKHPQQHCK